MNARLYATKRKGLSRILVEVILIVTVVAAASLLYYSWSSIFSPASKVVSASVVKVEGSAVAGAVWVTIKNTGNVALTSATLDYPSSGYTLTPTSFTLNPGDTTVFKVTGTFTAGTKYYFHLTLSDSSNTAKVGVDATITLN